VTLGYEDEDELEEAIGGSLAEFLMALPHFRVIWPDVPSGENGTGTQWAGPKATMLPLPDEDDFSGPGTCIVFTVSQREDLWRVVLQGPRANIDIPELDFAIRPKTNRRVDTIYNMIAAAVFHLGDHVQKNSRAGAISDDEAAKICATIDGLNQLLDVEQSFTFIISDPQGVSELKPPEGAHVGPYDGETATDAAMA